MLFAVLDRPTGIGRLISFALTDWPNQWARMVAWRAVEFIQHNFAGIVGRKPGKRMIIDAPLKSNA